MFVSSVTDKMKGYVSNRIQNILWEGRQLEIVHDEETFMSVILVCNEQQESRRNF